MDFFSAAVFDTRERTIEKPTGGNKWDWFTERGIKLFQMAGSKTPEDAPIEQLFENHTQLFAYLARQETPIPPNNVVYVSDNQEALQQAWSFGFLTLALPPAKAMDYIHCAAISFPGVTALTGLFNFLYHRFKKRNQ